MIGLPSKFEDYWVINSDIYLTVRLGTHQGSFNSVTAYNRKEAKVWKKKERGKKKGLNIFLSTQPIPVSWFCRNSTVSLSEFSFFEQNSILGDWGQ